MEMGPSALSGLARLKAGVRSKRNSSFDTTGGNADYWLVPAGQTRVISEMKRAGCVKHIWMTTTQEENALRRLLLRMFWDGEETPSVQCPLGDFFGLGHARGAYSNALPIQTSYLAMNCFFPMPYSRGARITVTNDSDRDGFLYFHVDYEEWAKPDDDLARFHACWHRQLVVKKDEVTGPNALGNVQRLNTTGKDNFTVLDVKGRGHYVGCFLHIDTNEPGWWGEGDDMFFIDGEPWPPSIHGTGTEDYFLGAWDYNRLREVYSTPYHGYFFRGNADYTGKHSQYRFHIEDPVHFEKSLLFSIEHGHANDRQGDWSSTAYWYQVGRKEPLPDVGTFEDRIPYAFGGLERWPGKDRKGIPW